VANSALLWGSLDRPFKQGFVLDDDRYMDRVQHLSVTGDGTEAEPHPASTIRDAARQVLME
jgi:hypothetical protein